MPGMLQNVMQNSISCATNVTFGEGPKDLTLPGLSVVSHSPVLTDLSIFVLYILWHHTLHPPLLSSSPDCKQQSETKHVDHPIVNIFAILSNLCLLFVSYPDVLFFQSHNYFISLIACCQGLYSKLFESLSIFNCCGRRITSRNLMVPLTIHGIVTFAF